MLFNQFFQQGVSGIPSQNISVTTGFEYTHRIFGINTEGIDWGRPVELNQDIAKEFGIVAYYPGWPRGVGALYDIGNYRTHGVFASGAAPSWVNGKFGDPALSYVPNQYVEVQPGQALNTIGSVTIALWVLRSGSDAAFQRCVFKNSSNGNHYVWGLQLANSGKVQYNCTGTDNTQFGDRWVESSGSIIQSSGWKFLVATYNASTSTATIYIDGVYDTSGTPGTAGANSGTLISGNLISSTGTLNFARLRYNAADGGASYYSTNIIGNTLICNKALTASQVYRLYTTPYLAAWQPSTKTYFLPTNIIDSDEVINDAGIVSLSSPPADQTVNPIEEIILTRPTYGSGVTSVSKKSAFKEIDWGAPVSLNYDLAKEYGLISYYPGWPSNLTDWRDISGNGYHAALKAQTSWTTGKFSEYGLKFDGVDDYAELALPNVLSSSFTILSWLKLPSTQTDLNVWATSTVSSYSNYWIALSGGYITANRIRANMYDGANNPGINSVSVINNNTWYHCGMVRNVVTDTIGVVVNGAIEATTTDTTTSTPSYNTFRFGGQAQGGIVDRFIPCSMSGMSIFSKALTDSQISKLYNDPFALLWQPSSTTYFFPVGTGIITEEAFGEITILNPEAQSVQPCVSLELERAPFGSTICPASSGRKAIDWGEPVELDKDMAQEYGVVAYYPSWPSKASSLYDLGKSRAHARLNGSSWGMGPFGEPAIISNTGQYTVASSSLNDYGITNKLTFGCWIKLNSTGQTNKYCISNANTGAPYDDFSLIYGYTANKFEIYSESYTGTAPRTAMTTSINDILWRHIAWTYDGANVVGYINGIADVMSAKTFSFSTRAASRFSIGDPNGPAQTADMTVSGYFCCNKAITASEMFRLYNDPFLLAWQPTSKTYYLPIYQGIDTEEVVSEADTVVLDPAPQYINPITDLPLNRRKFGSSEEFKQVELSEQFELDTSVATGFGVIAAYPGFTRASDTYYDVGRAKKHAQLQNGAFWTNGLDGESAIGCDGNNDLVEIPAFTIPQEAGSITLRWQPTESLSGIQHPIFRATDAGFIKFLDIYSSSGTINAGWYNNGNDDRQSWSTTGSITTNQWYSLALTWVNGGVTSFYVNGQQKVSGGTLDASWDTATATHIRLMCDHNITNTAKGSVSYLAFYDRCLTIDQVFNIHKNPTIYYKQASNFKTYFLPINQGIDSEEALGSDQINLSVLTTGLAPTEIVGDHIVSLEATDQYVYPNEQFEINRIPFGNVDGINWGENISIDTETMREHGVVQYYPQLPAHRRQDRYIDVVSGIHNGTIFGGVAYVWDKFGGPALEFDGSNGYVLLNNCDLKASGSITMWWKPNELDDSPIFTAVAGPQSFYIYPISTSFVVGWQNGGNNDQQTWSMSGISIGEWYHVAVTWENSGPTKLYINGQLKLSAGTTDAQWNTTGATTCIGAYDTSAANAAIAISGLTIHNRPISQSEVNDLYSLPHQYLRAGRKTYYFSTAKGIDSAEATGDPIVTLTAPDQTVYPDKELVLPRKPFGSPFGSIPTDWATSTLNEDRAKQYGVQAYFAGWPNQAFDVRDIKGKYRSVAATGARTTGKFNEPATTFNGSTNHINFGDVLNVGANDFALSLWVNLRSNGDYCIASKGNNNGLASGYKSGWYLFTNSSGQVRWSLYTESTAQWAEVTSTTSLRLNTWEHIVVTRSSSTGTIYCNGVPMGQTTTQAGTWIGNVDTLSSYYIGTYDTGPSLGYYLPGSVSNFIHMNKIPTAGEIKNLYDNPFDLIEQTNKTYFLPIYQGIDSEEVVSTGDQLNLSVIMTGIATSYVSGDAVVLADQDIDTSSIDSAYVSGDHQLNLTLIQTGIATGYASGDHQLNLTLIQTGIATGYVSGDHQLNLTVIMTGIASTESISSIHEVVVGTIFIEPSSIDSAYASGDHQLNLTLLMTGITTGYLSGDALVLADQKIITTGISTAYVSGDHSVNYTIAPSGIGTAYVSGDHQLNLTLIQTGIATGYVSGSHQLNLTVLMTGIATAESISSVHEVVVGTIFIEASGIGSAYASGDHQLNLTLFMTGITTGYLSGTAIVYTIEYVTVSSIDSNEMVGSHRVNYSISTTSIDSVEIFGSHQLNLKIFASSIGTSELMGTTVVIREQFISTSGIATAYVSGDHSFKYIITPSGIATAGSVNSPTINSSIHMTGISTSYASGSTRLSLTLIVSGIATAEAVGSQIVRRDFAVAPSGIATTEIFGSHQLNLTIIGSSIASTNIFGSLIVVPGGVSVIPNGIDSTEARGIPLVNANLTVIPPGLDSDEVVNQILIGTGISPAGITSSEQIGIHLIELQPYIGFFASTYVGYNFNTPMF